MARYHSTNIARSAGFAAAAFALVQMASLLRPSLAGAQMKRGGPGPDSSGFTELRTRISEGEQAARAIRAESGRPAILLIGLWPPTNEMVRRFSDNLAQNPTGWSGDDWEGRGYDVYAFFPEFPAGPSALCDWGAGVGDFEVDYQDTAADFWSVVASVQPRAIISFGRGEPGDEWAVDVHMHNHRFWYDDYVSPRQPAPNPPDAGWPVNGERCSTLPAQEIADRVNTAALGFTAVVGQDSMGNFICEYLAYHDAWYRAQHEAPDDPARVLAAGHVHAGFNACTPDVAPYKDAVDETLRPLIELLDAGQEIPPTILKADSTGPSEITLVWTGTSPRFEVLRADGGCSGVFVSQINTTAQAYLDFGLVPGNSYGYIVRSFDFCEHDSACVEVVHTLCDASALAPVPLLRVVNGAAGGVDLSWNAVTPAPPEYHVNSTGSKTGLSAPYRGQAGVTAEGTTSTTTWNDADALTAPSPIFYQVLAACSNAPGEEGPK